MGGWVLWLGGWVVELVVWELSGFGRGSRPARPSRCRAWTTKHEERKRAATTVNPPPPLENVTRPKPPRASTRSAENAPRPTAAPKKKTGSRGRAPAKTRVRREPVDALPQHASTPGARGRAPAKTRKPPQTNEGADLHAAESPFVLPPPPHPPPPSSNPTAD